MYKVMIYKNIDGLWCARKQYDIGKWGIPYMYSCSSESLKYKLIEDGEEECDIYVCDVEDLKNIQEIKYG